MTHPLAIGTRIRSIQGAAQGDWDEDDDGTERRADPGEAGAIVSRISTPDGWSYGLVFERCEAAIFLDEAEVDNPASYSVLPSDVRDAR